MVVHAARQAVTGPRGSAVSDGDPTFWAKTTALDVPDWALPSPRVTKLIAQGMGLTRHAITPEGWPAKDAGIPQPRPGAVGRASLVHTARSSHCRVVAVTAPAGYGKSTFLAEWAAAEDRRVAWVSLDRFDDDPGRLLVSLASAYCRAGLGSTDLVADMCGPGVAVLGRAAPRLAAEFRASPVPFVLMLDDLHELHSTACHDALSVVISGLPPGSQLVAASRSEQPHLPRLRASGEALEFGPAELTLDSAGAQQIFANAQVSLTPEQAATVTKRTEGWPAGLYLTAAIAKKSRGREPTVSGEDPYVADYLYSEALAQQPKAMQRFLRRTAVLDQLCGPLCDAVLGSSAAAIHLRRAEASGLFLIPLDQRRRWYRYHDLFQEFLLAELRRTEPGIITTLQRRAADWYEANGSPARALEQLLHTADWERTARLATALALPASNAGQLPTVNRWLHVIGDENIERYPPLAVHAVWTGVLTGNPVQAERWAAFVDAASFDGAPPDGSASFDSARAIARAAMCANGPEAMLADADFAVAQEHAWSPWRGTALWLLGEAHLLAGQLSEARTALAEASAAAAASNRHDAFIISETHFALLAMDRGEWQGAASGLELAIARIEEKRAQDDAACLLTFAAAARLSLHRGDLNETHRQLARAMRARPSATYVLPYVAVRLRLHLAKVYLALADVATARQLIREVDDILSHRPALGALNGEVDEFRPLLRSSTTPEVIGRPPLSAAELRLLPYLQTHLTVAAIAERLFVSRHTIRTEVKSIYRKLGVSSRSDAVQQATTIGLLGA